MLIFTVTFYVNVVSIMVHVLLESQIVHVYKCLALAL